jgi:hypothetical protein
MFSNSCLLCGTLSLFPPPIGYRNKIVTHEYIVSPHWTLTNTKAPHNVVLIRYYVVVHHTV